MNIFTAAANNASVIGERQNVAKKGHTPFRLQLLLRVLLTILKIIEGNMGLSAQVGRERGGRERGGRERGRERGRE